MSEWAAPPPRPSVIDRITGLVTYVSEIEIERSDPQLFVVVARVADVAVYGFPTSAVLHGSAAGASARRAYGAAVGECAERYASCVLHPEDLIHGSYDEQVMRGNSPVAPERWALFHEEQYDAVPFVRFQAGTPIAWVRAESLTHASERLVPASLVYLCAPEAFTSQGSRLVGVAVSTGAACARTRAEALLKGFCEVVERDAYIIMWRNRLPRPRLRIDSQSAIYATYNDTFKRPGLDFSLFYTTLDLGVPSFFGMLSDTRHDPPRTVVGGAAHLNPCTAALKTLTELVQGLKWMDSFGDRTFPIEEGFRNVRSFDDRVLLYACNHVPEAFRFLTGSSAEIDLSSIASLETPSVRTDLQVCYDIARERSLEVLALDLTSVDLAACGLHVTKVLIPECQPMEGDHQAQFLGGQRWREVPYRLGLQAAPAGLESVNPWPHPYP